MTTALIGHTGFVGSNLSRQHRFDAHFNSSNFEAMRGCTFDLLVCAGVASVKWKANKEPAADAAGIAALQRVLATVQAKTMVLISTIDVYPMTRGVDERFDCSTQPNHAYGTHRLQFERFCQSHFSTCHVIRLPALFGQGLKKNVIFDLIHDNGLDVINPASSFQYYNLARIWSDVDRVIESKLSLVNLFTEPVPTQQIIDQFFPNKRVGENQAPEMHYDLYTHHAGLWGKSGHYIERRDEVLDGLSTWLAKQS